MLKTKKIYKQKLEEISNAALSAVEYINDLLAELEANEEDERIAELKAIKKKVIESVKQNEKEVKAEMQRRLWRVYFIYLVRIKLQEKKMQYLC